MGARPGLLFETVHRPPRPFVLTTVILCLLLFLTATFYEPLQDTALRYATLSRPHHDIHDAIEAASRSRFHMLLPASSMGIGLCKTLLTSAMLDYPAPTLIAWNDSFTDEALLGGGSHIAKITSVLEYLEAMPESAQNDIVGMFDAYDIWFQLRPEVLLSRYHMINAKANQRLRKTLGKAYDAENIHQSIVFGAGKRCAPNQMHTIACYPIPDSPLPDDLYGNNTDTVIGRTKYSSLKQRYLNSGYIMGPLKDMRAMFRRAQEKVEARDTYDWWDNGSGQSGLMYHGSDQSIFNIIWGEQEYMREKARRDHLSMTERLRDKFTRKHTQIEGTIIEDVLNPSFTHEPMRIEPGRSYEFGIGVDYFSDLGQQTMNTDDDSVYLKHNEPLATQLADRTGRFLCPSRLSSALPQDILSSPPPTSSHAIPWSSLSLYTNVCLGTIPVMIHHNGEKGARGYDWPNAWMQAHARQGIVDVLSRNATEVEGGGATGGAYLSDGQHLTFQELCPQQWEWELFRDIEKPEEDLR